MKVLRLLTFCVLIALSFSQKLDGKPNIVIIMADDMGSYDASFRGSNQIITPNIDALAYHGVTFDRFYTPHMCTPSRASMMTGKYPHTLGMQTWVIPANEAWGLSPNEKLMSNHFNQAGYKTHLIGKWHLGFFQKKYTPTNRGFDSFFGYYNGLIDYYNYTYVQPPYTPGYDFRNNTEVYDKMNPGSYATDLFTDESLKIIKNHETKKNPLFLMINHLAPHTGNNYELLQAPNEEIAKFTHIKDPKRRILAAMISKLDESVGKVVEALKQKGILDNTIILFYSDNGAPTAGLFENNGSNHPLRGQKNGPWEGATRNLGFIFSPLIKKRQRVFDGYFHTADILPTLAAAAGIKISKVDGFNQWNALMTGGKSPRNEVVAVLDNIEGFSAIISGKWKIVNGTTLNGAFDAYLGKIDNYNFDQMSYANRILSSKVGKSLADTSLLKCHIEKLTAATIQRTRKRLTISCNDGINPIRPCNPLNAPCLFDIIEDPCERENVASIYPAILNKLRLRMNELVKGAAATRRTFVTDERCDPAMYGGVWESYVADNVYSDDSWVENSFSVAVSK